MTMNKKTVFPFLILLFSVFYFVEAIKLGAPVTAEGIRPSFVPLVLGALASLFSLLLTIKAAASPKAGDSKSGNAVDGPAEEPASVKPAILTIIAIAIYIAMFTTVGYVLSSMVFVFAIIVIFSARDKWLSKLATSAAIVAFGYIVFEQLFGVRLPTLWG